jgi:riboflavin synthase
VAAIDDAGGARSLTLAEPRLAGELHVGESVAVNGACLTVIRVEPPLFSFQAGSETLSRTNLGRLEAGSRVNLERAVRLGDRLGGHWVQGHIDGTGRVAERLPEGEWERVWLACAVELSREMVPKGSVAVDGVSLTLVEVESGRFSVALIPHTLSATTLGLRQVGDLVNIETDILAKYVAKAIRC